MSTSPGGRGNQRETPADPIHYDPSKSYRDAPYRQIHHQNGCIGNFTVHIVEGKNLVRGGYWSVFGIGVVKHLGLSKAHGEVSSYAEFRLGFRSREEKEEDLEVSVEEGTKTTDDDCSSYSSWGGMSRSAVSKSTRPNPTTSGISTSSSNRSKISPPDFFPQNSKTYRSSTVSSNSNPKWPSAQSSTTKSIIKIPLHKGVMLQDGMKIILEITMREEKTVADTLLPGIVRGGSGDGRDEALGWSSLDVTNLVLQDYDYDDDGGGDGGDVIRKKTLSHGITEWDTWVNVCTDGRGVRKDIELNEQNMSSGQKEGAQLQKGVSDKATVGKVRLLISYERVGLRPQKGDIVALESFARRPPSLTKSRPILQPLYPLTVVDVKGEYLLVNFDTVLPFSSKQTQRNDAANNTKTKKTCIQSGQVRLHLNSVFVIERTNLIDSAYNIALKPADMAMSTSIGKEVSDRAHPYVAVAGDLIMPAVASARFLLNVSSAAFVGFKSATADTTQGQQQTRERRHSFPD